MLDGKHQLLRELNASREELWSLLETLDDTVEIYPGWKKREFFAHIAGWEAMVFEVIHNHLTHQSPKSYDYTNADDANTRFIAVRQSTTVEDARLECEINRFAIQTMLETIDDYSEVIRFPWGDETVTQFIVGAVDHERSHAADIRNLRPAR